MSKTVSGLYAVTPEIADSATLLCKVEAALRGGASVVQYRNKSATEILRREQAGAIAQMCRRASACFICNDDPRLAREVEADGVHLGKDDGSVAAARALLGSDRLVGVSCYNRLSRAREAISQGADYIAFGRFFVSTTKPGAAGADPELLRAARREFALPIVAIGGITADNAGSLIEAGADAVAVVVALFDAADVENEARRFTQLFAVRGYS